MKLLITVLSLLLYGGLFGQNSSIKGQVVNVENEPLEGVNVYIKSNKKVGSETDSDGYFEINDLKDNTYKLMFSSLGFQTKVVQVDLTQSKEINLNQIKLVEGNEVLNEVFINSDRTNKFVRKQSSYVSKLPLKDVENTQVYSTVTSELLESQVVTNFDDALKNATGIQQLWQSTGRAGSGAGFYALRGFSVQPRLVNGMPGLTNGTFNPANIEKIEVIKGPSATLFGNTVSSFGGLINVVTKKPYEGTGGEISFTSGSYGLNKISADFNTALSKEDNIYLRVNTAYSTKQSFQDAGFRKSFFVAPSLTYRVNDRLSFSFDAEITQAEQTNPTFLFLNRNAPTESQNLEELGYNNELSFTSNDLTLKNPSQYYRVEMDYKLSDNWQSQTLLSKSSASTTGYYSFLFDYLILGNDTFTRFISKNNANTQTTDIQQNFIGDFKIASLRNRVVIGVDYLNRTQTDNSTGFAFYGNVTPEGGTNSDNPFTEEVETGPFPLSTSGVDGALESQGVSNSKSQSDTYSIYASDVINVTNKLSAMVGLRLDRFENDGDVTTDEDDFEQTAFSPKFGVMYQPIDDKLSVFANYQNGFINVAPQLVGNPEDGPQTLKTFDPEQANQLEFGVKTNLFDGRLNSVISYYNINVEDRVIPGNTPFTQVQGGEVESKGIEVELNANPVDGLNIRAGYSYNDSEVIEGLESSAFFEEGRRPSEAGPRNNYNAWASYQFNNGSLNGFGLGFGINGSSKRFIVNTEATGRFTVPAYTLANASLFYQTKDYRIALKLNNAFDKEYYTGWTTINPQQPRSLLANFTYRF